MHRVVSATAGAVASTVEPRGRVGRIGDNACGLLLTDGCVACHCRGCCCCCCIARDADRSNRPSASSCIDWNAVTWAGSRDLLLLLLLPPNSHYRHMRFFIHSIDSPAAPGIRPSQQQQQQFRESPASVAGGRLTIGVRYADGFRPTTMMMTIEVGAVRRGWVGDLGGPMQCNNAVLCWCVQCYLSKYECFHPST